MVVDCPSCGGKAVVTLLASDTDLPRRNFVARRMVCHACGATREQALTPRGQAADPFIGLKARLRAETRHGDLIAWNEVHLDYLEQYLSGRLRIETPDETGRTRNKSVVSRLPAWAKSAKNRDEVLKAIAGVRLEKL